MDGSAVAHESSRQAPFVIQPVCREEGKGEDRAVHEARLTASCPLGEPAGGLEQALAKLGSAQVLGSPDRAAYSPTDPVDGGPQIPEPTQATAPVVVESYAQQVPETAATAAAQLEEGQEVPEPTHAVAAAFELEVGQLAGTQLEQEGRQMLSPPQETAGPPAQVNQPDPGTVGGAGGPPDWEREQEVPLQVAAAAAQSEGGQQVPDSMQPTAAAPAAPPRAAAGLAATAATATAAATPATTAAAAASPLSGSAVGSPTGRQAADAAAAHQTDQTLSGGNNGGKPKLPRPEGVQECPRCSSKDTKFCYYNNYNIKQPRYFCRACQRYWTAGGSLREIPVGAGRRKSKAAKKDGFTGERSPQAPGAAAMPPSASEPALSAAAVAMAASMAASMAAAPAASMAAQASAAAPLGLSSAPGRNPLPTAAAPGLLGPAPVLPQDPALAALLAAGSGGGAGLPLPNGGSLGAGVPPQMTMPGALPPPYGGMQPPGGLPGMMPPGNPYMSLSAGGLAQGLGTLPPHMAAAGLPPFLGGPSRMPSVPSSFPPASYPPAAPAQPLSLPAGLPPATAGAAGPSAAAVLSETLNKLTALPSSALGGPQGYPPPLAALTSLAQSGSLPTSSAMVAAAQALGAAQSLGGGGLDGSGAVRGSGYGMENSLPGGSRPAMVPMAQPLRQEEDGEEDGGVDGDGQRAAKRPKFEPAAVGTAAAAAAAAAGGGMDEPGGPGTGPVNHWQQQEPGVPQPRDTAIPAGPSPNPLSGSAISALATLAAAAQGAAAGPNLASSLAPSMVPQPLPPAPTASPFGAGPSAYGPSAQASSLATLGRFYDGLAGAAGPPAMPAALGHGLGGSMGSMLGASDATLGVAGPLSSEFFAAARAAQQQQQQGLGLSQLPPGPYGHPGGPMQALAGAGMGGGGGWPYGSGMGSFIPQQQGWGGGYPPPGPGYGLPRYQFPGYGGLGTAPLGPPAQMPPAGLGLAGLGSMLGGAAAAALPPSLQEAEMARALAQVPTCTAPSSGSLGWLGGAPGHNSWAGMPPSNGLVGLAQLNPNLNPPGYPPAMNPHHHQQQQQQQPYPMMPQHQQQPLQQQQQYLPPSALLGQGRGYGMDLAGLLPPGAGGFMPGTGPGTFGMGGAQGTGMVAEAAPSQMDSARA